MHAPKRNTTISPERSPVLTAPEAAEYLGCGVTMLYRLIARGDLKSFTLGKSRRFTRAACDALIAERESA